MTFLGKTFKYNRIVIVSTVSNCNLAVVFIPTPLPLHRKTAITTVEGQGF